MLANLLILFPFAVAALIYFAGGRSAKNISLAAALILFLINVFALRTHSADATNSLLKSDLSWIQSIHASWLVSLDGMSLFMTLLSTLIVPLIFMSIDEDRYPKGFYPLAWMMIGAMIGVFTAKDGLLFYIFWELALIPIYFICLLWGGEHKAKITFKFFVYTLFGSLFMLAALIYLYNKAGSWDINALYAAGASMSSVEQCLVFWGLFLGFAVKMPVWPFHTWQPDTYTNAPTQATMLLSGIMLKMGTYGAIRWLVPMVPAGLSCNQNAVMVLSIIGIVYASIIALTQKDFKRMVAWSSIGHVGLISAGIFAANAIGIKGAFLQMLAHGINVVGLFFIIDIIEKRLGTRDMTLMGGIRSVNPKLALLFLFITLGSVALPLTNSFVGEFLLLNGVFLYNRYFALFAGLTVIFGAVYMLRAYQSTMLGESNKLTSAFGALNSNEKMLLVVISILIIVFGLFPNALLDLIGPGVEDILLHSKTIIN